jgi:hypothetical protein
MIVSPGHPIRLLIWHEGAWLPILAAYDPQLVVMGIAYARGSEGNPSLKIVRKEKGEDVECTADQFMRMRWE